ncbi:signal recognition particle 9 kDa subunit [Dictyostelium purpureum]|uniref:Signal recognition particle 9 kDa protein n=1 Tax=Dictyostelium purpureum TaxID=5786 RepID=F0ZEM6_DICPU|nr:signal recognition particle 9 kDa subunit [Dictyostelium purpureum]EGC37598.1 signal recognition particle 9 kDa subunit [Dictyostelium purpureum]|eukprot:XP_003285859.1 signal recognition particle 9 kDa subunit [Dictyostelium purpureum]
MYINDWEEFYDKSEQLYRQDPKRTRFVFKFRHIESKVVLKVTNDTVNLQYQTDKEDDFQKIEQINSLFFRIMTEQ